MAIKSKDKVIHGEIKKAPSFWAAACSFLLYMAGLSQYQNIVEN